MNRKVIVTAALLCVVGFMAMSPAKEDEKPKFTNLKVLPKNISDRQLHAVMDEWASALGTRCGFCHVRNEETKKMDWALDTKPEKEMARHMFKMMSSINKKYFGAKKDSTGIMMETGINCNTCHRGNSHPEIVKAAANRRRPDGPPPGGQPAPNAAPAGQGAGSPPPSGGK